MEVQALEVADVKLIVPKKLGDHRGFFSETYHAERLRDAGIDWTFVQDNHSCSADAGTVRGLHFQIAPAAQGKLIRVVRGAIFDVCVDIRAGSPTFGRHVATIVSAEVWNQVLVPVGFAHGFCTIEPNTEVIYKVTEHYSPEHERGLLWNDPDLKIQWPEAARNPTLSARDKEHPRLRELPVYFK